MAEEPKVETMAETVKEELYESSSSPTDSDGEGSRPSASSGLFESRRLFGRQRPVREVLGGGRTADVLLWRNKKAAAAVLCGATAIWALLELMNYHLLPLVCYGLMLVLAVTFLYSKATTLINKSPPCIPEVSISQDLAVNMALSLSHEINQVLAFLRDAALGCDVKKFITVITGLWLVSIISSCCDFLTLFYIVFVLLHTVPYLYERYEDKIDPFAEKVAAEIRKQYAVFDAKVLRRIQRRPLKDKKQQ